MNIARVLPIKCGLVFALLATSFLGISFAQADGGRFINEVPKGMVDGWNTTFTVSQTPQGARTDFLYRNGVPLVYETDYQVSSNVISIAPSQVPQVGDSLYFSYVPAANSTRSISATPGPVAPAENRDEVSIAASREALRSEARNLSPTAGEGPTDRRLHLFHGSNLGRQHETEALTMLSSRLAEGTGGVADGVEGLGDAPEPSVYSANPQSSLRDRATSNHEESSSRNIESWISNIPPTEADSNSAIQLLESRLSKVDPQQISNLGTPAETTEPDSTPMYGSQHSVVSPSRELHKLGRTSREAIDMLGNRLGIAGVSEISR